MPRIPFALGSHERTRGHPPPLRLVNIYPEESPATASRVHLISRRGLSRALEVGPGPVRGSIQRDGFFNGVRFTVSGGTLYKGTTALGGVDGDGPVYMANSDTELLVCAGGGLFSYNGSGFDEVVMPFDEGVTAVRHIDGLFIALRAGTAEWYFSDVLDGRTFNALNFATAESEADRLLDIVVMDGTLILFGTETVEFWAKSGDPEIPYTPIKQRILRQGIIATGCAVQEDNSFFWIGRDAIAYRFDTVPKAISDDAWVEKAKASTTHRVFVVEEDRHKFICHRMDGVTLGFDITTSEIVEFQSYNRANWRLGPDMGDDELGVVWELSGDDDDGGEIARIFTAGNELEAPTIVNHLRLHCETGSSEHLTGQYADPPLEMRLSRDGGRTWEDWRTATLGTQGQYGKRVAWFGLGMFNFPGMIFQFRITAPVGFRATTVTVNDGFGGIDG